MRVVLLKKLFNLKLMSWTKFFLYVWCSVFVCFSIVRKLFIFFCLFSNKNKIPDHSIAGVTSFVVMPRKLVPFHEREMLYLDLDKNSSFFKHLSNTDQCKEKWNLIGFPSSIGRTHYTNRPLKKDFGLLKAASFK